MRSPRLSIIGSLLLLSVFITPSPVGAASAQPGTSYLVGLRAGASAATLTHAGFDVLQAWSGLRAVQVVADAQVLARLRTNPAVSYVEADQKVSMSSNSAAADSGEITAGLQAIRAPDAWKLGSTGQGIRLCVLDSGIDYSHPEFQDGVINGSKNFVDDGHTDAADGVGHGTHVAGTIAAELDQQGVVGAAYGLDLYVARVLGDDGTGTTSELLDGVNWCINTVHARILNISSGSDRPSRTEQRVFDTALSKGVLTFAASGNSGNNRISYPAGYDSVIAVGAVDSQDKLAAFSSYGRDQELVAPGVHVLSSVPVGTGRKTAVSEDNTSYANNAVEFSATGSTSGPLVECGLAESDTSCTNAPANGSWVALIKRGTITFAEKVQNVMSQGASAAIITNNDTANPNDSSGFTLGSDGSWVPTVSVSYNSGVAIRSAGLGTASVAVTPWNYAYYDGTSMASPHAAAVAALAWSANPALSGAQIRTVLHSSAKDLGAAGRDQKFGYGLIEADNAVKLARATKP